MPAFAETQGNRALAGIALAGFSAGSLVGGLVAGLRPTRDERRRIIVGSFVLAGLMALPLLATSIWTMAMLMFCAGLPIAPVVAALYGQIGRVAAAGSVAEAFSWFGTSVSIGIAGGNRGRRRGDRRARLARRRRRSGSASSLSAAIVTTLRRSTLAPPIPHAERCSDPPTGGSCCSQSCSCAARSARGCDLRLAGRASMSGLNSASRRASAVRR